MYFYFYTTCIVTFEETHVTDQSRKLAYSIGYNKTRYCMTEKITSLWLAVCECKPNYGWFVFCTAMQISHFWLLLCLCFKTSLSAKPLIRKLVLHAGLFSCKSKNGFALRLALKQRHKGTRKCLINTRVCNVPYHNIIKVLCEQTREANKRINIFFFFWDYV